MSKPKKKRVKIILGVLIAVLMLGVCFTSVAFYAKKEINKPLFTIPPEKAELLPSASPLPEDADTAAAYAQRLFDEAMTASDAEMSCRTEVSLAGDWQTPLADADAAVLSYLKDTAAELVRRLLAEVNGRCEFDMRETFAARVKEGVERLLSGGDIEEDW